MSKSLLREIKYSEAVEDYLKATYRIQQQQGKASTAVTETSDHDLAPLRFLGDIGVLPNEGVAVLDETPLNGPICVHVAGATHLVDREVAEHVIVAARTMPSDA